LAAPPATGSLLIRGTCTVAASFSFNRIGPRTTAETSAPMTMAICWLRGVAPTRKPVFRSWDVVPPLDEAMQTMAPTDRAVT
jgi:hypothetical protein